MRAARLLLVWCLAPACTPDRLELLPQKSAGSADAGDAGASHLEGQPEAAVPDGFECDDNADCFGHRSRCETASHRCVECLGPADCDPGDTCDPVTSRCAPACSSDRECRWDRGLHCDLQRHVCIGCTSEPDCTLFSPYLHCDVASGQCVMCRDGADCPSGARYCDSQLHFCKQCLTVADCPSGYRFCDSERGLCTVCQGDTGCPRGSICDPSIGRCFVQP